ncbi:hypothetical protein V5J35_003012 [Endozoicomonas sp. NE40]|uniref:Transposase n=1 Tax=Endozoicomonas lisbonensis TaxID=3120522 RepID=A0ABV2SJ93_9GAMM
MSQINDLRESSLSESTFQITGHNSLFMRAPVRETFIIRLRHHFNLHQRSENVPSYTSMAVAYLIRLMDTEL